MEPYGSLWKTRECSIGRLGNQKGDQSRVKYKGGKERLGKREVVRDITPLLMSFRCQHHHQQQCSGCTQSWGEMGRPYSLWICCIGHKGEDSQFYCDCVISSVGNSWGSNIPQCCDPSYHTNRTFCHSPCPRHVWRGRKWQLEPCILFCPWSRGLGACCDRYDSVHRRWHWQWRVVQNFSIWQVFRSVKTPWEC